MKDQKFLHSNQAVIRYFLNLVHTLTPSYVPTLIGQSITKTLRPLIFIFGPKLIVDELMGLSRTNILVALIAGIAISNFLITLIEKGFQYRAQYMTDVFNNAFERHIADKTASIDFQHLEDPDVLDLKERALFAVRNHWLMGNMIQAIAKVLNESVLILSLIAVIWTFSPWIVGLLLVIVAINSLIFKRIQHYYYVESTESVGGNRAFVYFINQSADLEIAKDLRLYNMVDMVIGKMNAYNLNIYKLYIKIYGTISRLNGFVSVNVQIQTVVTYLLLASRTLRGTVSLGNFMMYAGTVGRFGTSINAFVSGIIEVNRLCRQLELLVEYEQIPKSTDTKGSSITSTQPSVIEFHQVSFKYPKANDYTLKNVSVRIEAGEKVSIIGLNGAGKTTFVKLLCRLYHPTQGKITLNGVDIATLDYKDYMDQVAAVFQDYRLFGISVEENITAVCADTHAHLVDTEKTHTILTQVGLQADVASLSNGLATTLDKSYDKAATKLSGGQAQKLAIARALYKPASVVVLDEPTAALDPIAEHDVYLKFNSLVEGKTAIYISYRMSSCRFCDRILVFENGTITQVGSHESLIQEKGATYEQMFTAQATYYSA